MTPRGNSNDARCMNIPSRPLEIDRSLLDRFDPITLERMDSIRLMNRIDTKYVTDILRLREILEDAQRQGYLVFESDGERIQAYDSIYFDTSDLRMFREHRRGKLIRQKIPVSAFLRSRKRTTTQGHARSVSECLRTISRTSGKIRKHVCGWPPTRVIKAVKSSRPWRQCSIA